MTQSKELKLTGIEEIQAFTEKEASTLLDWHRDFNFPMSREQGLWTALPVEIMAWFKERDCTPDTVNTGRLRNFEGKQQRETGTAKLHNKQLKGVKEIKEFLDKSQDSQILDLMRQFPACPIKRIDGAFCVDADELLIFIENYARPAGVFV